MFVRMLAGFLQAAVGVAVGAYGFLRHLPVVTHVENDITAGMQVQIHYASALFYFLLATPLGWLALWLFVEGLLRVLAAAMQQPFGSAPVALARWAWSARPRPKLPDDVVTRSGDAIVIDSAHRYDWHALTTVDVDGALYQVAREAGAGEHPHRYRLTPIAHDHVVRTVTRYATSARDGSSRTGRPPRR